jgi:hypothetical protein
MTNYPPIDECLNCLPLIQIAKTRKHSTITAIEYEALEVNYMDYFFKCNPQINRKSWSAWPEAMAAKEMLKRALKNKLIIVLPHEPPENVHSFKTSKNGFLGFIAIEQKIKLHKKLQLRNAQ